MGAYGITPAHLSACSEPSRKRPATRPSSAARQQTNSAHTFFPNAPWRLQRAVEKEPSHPVQQHSCRPAQRLQYTLILMLILILILKLHNQCTLVQPHLGACSEPSRNRPATRSSSAARPGRPSRAAQPPLSQKPLREAINRVVQRLKLSAPHLNTSVLLTSLLRTTIAECGRPARRTDEARHSCANAAFSHAARQAAPESKVLENEQAGRERRRL